MEGELTEPPPDVDIEHATVRRDGADVSLVAYGAGVWTALDAAEELAEEGVSAEVVDLRVLRPLDERCVLDSVARTHRAVLIDEMWRSGSFAAEVSARIMEGAFYDLDAPVARVCTAEVPIPYAQQLERAALPSVARVVAAAREVMARG
jgi:pyruvate dehydrogenase E1 component beta subunit